MYSLEFAVRHKYAGVASGITIPVDLGYGGNHLKLDAKLDTGAQFCLFDRGYGESLRIEIEEGHRLQMRTANSSFVAYGHEVSLVVLGFESHVMAYFPEDDNIHRSVLGREGWLLQVRLGLVDYDQLIYLSSYDG